MNLIERRTFLKTSALAAASAAAASRAGALTPAAATVPADGIIWDKAPCRFCGTGCHVKVGVRDGKVVAIAGHPDAAVNKGLLCVKGYHVGGILYGKDRLTTPMLRRDGVLEPITWDEAELLEVSMTTSDGTSGAERLGVVPKRLAAVLGTT